MIERRKDRRKKGIKMVAKYIIYCYDKECKRTCHYGEAGRRKERNKITV